MIYVPYSTVWDALARPTRALRVCDLTSYQIRSMLGIDILTIDLILLYA